MPGMVTGDLTGKGKRRFVNGSCVLAGGHSMPPRSRFYRPDNCEGRGRLGTHRALLRFVKGVQKDHHTQTSKGTDERCQQCHRRNQTLCNSKYVADESRY